MDLPKTPQWRFTTKWIDGICRIDESPCQFQVTLTRVVDGTLGPPNVSDVEYAIKEVVKERPTTAEELYERLCETAIDQVTVRCQSELHGLLECGDIL